jgi:hypothetical protein
VELRSLAIAGDINALQIKGPHESQALCSRAWCGAGFSGLWPPEARPCSPLSERQDCVYSGEIRVYRGGNQPGTGCGTVIQRSDILGVRRHALNSGLYVFEVVPRIAGVKHLAIPAALRADDAFRFWFESLPALAEDRDVVLGRRVGSG